MADTKEQILLDDIDGIYQRADIVRPILKTDIKELILLADRMIQTPGRI
jgi:hypothetical protein